MSRPPSPEDLLALSMLLDDELPEADAAALRQRLATEPALGAAWRQLQELPADLAALPIEPPPPAVQARLQSTLAPAPAAPSPRPALPWLVAAAGLLLATGAALWPRPPARLVVDAGGTVVDGRAHLAVADASVRVDGRAHLSLSCPTCPPEAPVLKSPLAAGAAGVALTVAVYEGSAWISSPEGEARTLVAGERADVPTRRDQQAAAPPRPPSTGAAPAVDRAGLPPAVAAELARLEDEVARLELENALVRGSLAAHEGKPVAWPDDLPEALGADAFPAQVAALFADRAAGELLAVDCSEYPCLAVVRAPTVGPGWEQQVMGRVEGLVEDLGEGFGVVAMGRGEDDGEQPVMLMGFAVVPPGSDPTELQTRLGYRAEDLLGTQAEALREEAAED